MVVGTTKLNFAELKRFVGKPQELVVYTTTLVPIWARHIDAIVMNQRYYVAIYLRNVLSIPYKERQELVNALIKDIRINGIISSFTPITDIVKDCDKKMLVKMLEVKLNGKET